MVSRRWLMAACILLTPSLSGHAEEGGLVPHEGSPARAAVSGYVSSTGGGDAATQDAFEAFAARHLKRAELSGDPCYFRCYDGIGGNEPSVRDPEFREFMALGDVAEAAVASGLPDHALVYLEKANRLLEEMQAQYEAEIEALRSGEQWFATSGWSVSWYDLDVMAHASSLAGWLDEIAVSAESSAGLSAEGRARLVPLRQSLLILRASE